MEVVRVPEFDIPPNPGLSVVLLTNDGRVGQSNTMDFYEAFPKKLVIFKKTKFVWFNVYEGVQHFSFTKATKMIELSQEEAIHKLKDKPRPTKIPNFHGEEIVITLVNNSVYSFLEPVVVNGSNSGWKVEGFQVLLLEMACRMMNLSVVYRASDWYGTFENGSFTPGIYRDLIDNKADASASGAFLRHEAIGLTEFSINWEPNCMRYLVPRPKHLNSSSRIFVSVFNQWFWLAILISVIVSSITAALAARMSHLPTQKCKYFFLDVYTKPTDISTVVIKMFFHLLQLHYPSRAEYKNALVPLLVTWGWMGFILTAMYCSQMAASFTKPVYTEKIQTEKQFIEHGYTFGSHMAYFDKNLLFDMVKPK
ncbi:hypothetical protein GE061_016893 [Apolygus lucorum]|uniref:Ionotropic glutamate receptor C-terminal domain-containing protein n=1 Tax=Apolygus lucorum TaxID=248454 RepID=A0A8S9XHK0_APOLU|nr:hypothetical protein GE061_016893 [Apolygus lucorum]